MFNREFILVLWDQRAKIKRISWIFALSLWYNYVLQRGCPWGIHQKKCHIWAELLGALHGKFSSNCNVTPIWCWKKADSFCYDLVRYGMQIVISLEIISIKWWFSNFLTFDTKFDVSTLSLFTRLPCLSRGSLSLSRKCGI